MAHGRARAKRMVRRHLASRDITDRRVLATMAFIPREAFVPPHLERRAYDDGPLTIGHGQTISQPYVVALMTQAADLDRHSRVLEVGTGSGYQTAILAKLASHVWSVERIPELSGRAKQTLTGLGFTNVTYVEGDGALGFPYAAPYDAIVVAAAAPGPPTPLIEQLAANGRLVIPIGVRDLQVLTVFRKTPTGIKSVPTAGTCRFVPLVSPAAFPE
jgi:protein-L-isoaspartate(D-aspartate) O-methyltransferase